MGGMSSLGIRLIEPVKASISEGEIRRVTQRVLRGHEVFALLGLGPSLRAQKGAHRYAMGASSSDVRTRA